MKWIVTVKGFFAFAALAAAMAFWLVSMVGADKMGDLSKFSIAVYGPVAALWIPLLAELKGLRDMTELTRDQRQVVRIRVKNGIHRVWLLLATFSGLTVFAFLAEHANKEAVITSVAFTLFAPYTLAICLTLHNEIQDFKSRVFDQERQNKANEAHLAAILKDADKGFKSTDGMKKFIPQENSDPGISMT